jgi:hypothetical protein
MLKSELIDRKLFIFPDGTSGKAMLWIRDGDVFGSVGVPCHFENLDSALRGATYHAAAPGVDCAFRPSDEGVELELLGPGGVTRTWQIDGKRLRAALDELETGMAPEEGNPYLG